MIFTSRRTYRVAIRRSKDKERFLQILIKRTKREYVKAYCRNELAAQNNWTRKLQARKRRERK